ncbi:phage tail protein I [Luteibacter sp. 1214]|uniref:phage tail protein I n=1 Tax=Luteibacter sp. 1214 TaxID=2817735 RepID=UPI00286B3272|nr:phage tail protein I [Luteibacter sp. 1214]
MRASVNSLLPANATELERALEQVGLSLLDLPVAIDTLWNPDTISADLLPWLAWSLSVDSWKPYWSEVVKRNRVKSAIDIARRKGTAKAVRDVVESFGGHVEITEWWQTTPMGVPHTFSLILTVPTQGGQQASAEFVDDIIAEVRRAKPARSHFTFTQGMQAMGGVGLIAAARPLSYRRLSFNGV